MLVLQPLIRLIISKILTISKKTIRLNLTLYVCS